MGNACTYQSCGAVDLEGMKIWESLFGLRPGGSGLFSTCVAPAW